MSIKIFKQLALAVFFLCGFYSGTDAQKKDNHIVLEDDWIDSLLMVNKIPAVGIGIIRGGKLTQVKVYGEIKKGEPAPYNTIFNVASLTKPVVAMLTLTLVNQGNWNLDEPLSKYWTDPDVANDPRSKKLTTYHVLTHQTGFMNWRWMHPTKKLTFDFDPGTKFRYSGEGLEYLKKALENKFGKTLDRLADSLIFKPLKMTDTRMVWDGSVEKKRFANWHDTAGNNIYSIIKRKEASAADDLMTTIEDYGNFSVGVLQGFELSKDLYSNLVKPHASIKKGDAMGLGWEIMPELRDQQYAMLHTGSDQGVHTLVILLPFTKEGLLIFTNGDNGYKLYFELIPELLSLGKEIIERAD